jgi:hypothetical protein
MFKRMRLISSKYVKNKKNKTNDNVITEISSTCLVVMAESSWPASGLNTTKSVYIIQTIVEVLNF